MLRPTCVARARRPTMAAAGARPVAGRIGRRPHGCSVERRGFTCVTVGTILAGLRAEDSDGRLDWTSGERASDLLA